MEDTVNTVLYVGMDVHSTRYCLATFALGDREVRFEFKSEPDYELVLQYLGGVYTSYVINYIKYKKYTINMENHAIER